MAGASDGLDLLGIAAQSAKINQIQEDAICMREKYERTPASDPAKRLYGAKLADLQQEYIKAVQDFNRSGQKTLVDYDYMSRTNPRSEAARTREKIGAFARREMGMERRRDKMEKKQAEEGANALVQMKGATGVRTGGRTGRGKTFGKGGQKGPGMKRKKGRYYEEDDRPRRSRDPETGM